MLISAAQIRCQEERGFLQDQPCNQGIMICILSGADFAMFRPQHGKHTGRKGKHVASGKRPDFGAVLPESIQKGMKALESASLIFMDPDNGLRVKSVGKRSVRSVKYAFYEEVREFIKAGKSVLVYNHRSRKPEAQYFSDIEDRIVKETEVQKDMILGITFPRSSIRDYFAIPACTQHYEMFKAAFSDMLQSEWGQLGVCREPKR